MNKTRIRTGRGQPNITCQNLGCYHAVSQGLNCRPGLDRADSDSDLKGRGFKPRRNRVPQKHPSVSVCVRTEFRVRMWNEIGRSKPRRGNMLKPGTEVPG